MLTFDPYAQEMDENPFPFYAALREEAPCYWSDQAGMWILTRYDDVQNALLDWQTYSSAKGNLMDEFPGRAGSTLGSSDPPRHDRIRALIQSAFAKKNMDYLIEPAVQTARQSLDAMEDKAEFDFIADFSSKITVKILFFMLGLPEEDHQRVRSDVQLMIQTDAATRKKSQESIDAFQRMADYARAIVEERQKSPRDDMVSLLGEAEIDGDKLNPQEVVLTTTTLIMAGVESMSSFLAMFALNLHDHPDARRRIAANPDLTAKAIEESLRFNTSAQRFRRALTTDTELHGQAMKAGDFVCLCYGSANRDSRKFPNADVYDIERNPRAHLGFGGGRHVCLGAAMARMVTKIAMDEFLNRVPDFHLTADRLPWTPSTTFRSPRVLPFARERVKAMASSVNGA